MSRRAELNRRSERMTDRELLDAYAAAYEDGDELAASIFGAEADHRDCWR